MSYKMMAKHLGGHCIHTYLYILLLLLMYSSHLRSTKKAVFSLK